MKEVVTKRSGVCKTNLEPPVPFTEYYNTTPDVSEYLSPEKFFDESILHDDERHFQKSAAPIPRALVDDFIRTPGKDFDDEFGIYFDPDKKSCVIRNLKIGYEPDILLGANNLRYRGTPGFYELLFKKYPVGYQPNDLDNYIDIGRRSGAHYQQRNPVKGLSTSNSDKFVRIIKPRITTFHSITQEKTILKQSISRQNVSRQHSKYPLLKLLMLKYKGGYRHQFVQCAPH